ncbi:MAG: PTS sugar transporter subunit IIA [Pelolinea sp.]|nr:PTS sugar transporter subunit IIA [Pelolinea sp.]
MLEMVISEQLAEIDFEAKDKEEVIKLLSGKMDKMGYVEAGFEEAVLAREREYPTGLPTKIPVALCHVEAEYVNRTALAIATLKKPVEFHNMGDPKMVLPVEIVFLLTIVDPKEQVIYLRKMMEIFKDGTLLKMKDAQSKKEIVSILYNYFIEAEERNKDGKKKI